VEPVKQRKPLIASPPLHEYMDMTKVWIGREEEAAVWI
jgi:hypothetical protein